MVPLFQTWQGIRWQQSTFWMSFNRHTFENVGRESSVIKGNQRRIVRELEDLEILTTVRKIISYFENLVCPLKRILSVSHQTTAVQIFFLKILFFFSKVKKEENSNLEINYGQLIAILEDDFAVLKVEKNIEITVWFRKEKLKLANNGRHSFQLPLLGNIYLLIYLFIVFFNLYIKTKSQNLS